MTNQEEWSNAGGCSWKHPFNKERRTECERLASMKKEAKISKKGSSGTEAEAELLLSQAALVGAGKEDTSWSAGQTLMVVGGALVGLTIMTIVIIKMKKS